MNKVDEDEDYSTIDILFAEDHPANVQVIRQHLAHLNVHHRAKIAFNGEEVTEMFARIVCKAIEAESHPNTDIQPIKLIFLDYQMPKMTGTDAIEKIQRFLSDANKNRKGKIIEPHFVFLTAFKTKHF